MYAILKNISEYIRTVVVCHNVNVFVCVLFHLFIVASIDVRLYAFCERVQNEYQWYICHRLFVVVFGIHCIVCLCMSVVAGLSHCLASALVRCLHVCVI